MGVWPHKGAVNTHLILGKTRNAVNVRGAGVGFVRDSPELCRMVARAFTDLVIAGHLLIFQRPLSTNKAANTDRLSAINRFLQLELG